MARPRTRTVELPAGVHAVKSKGKTYYYLIRHRGTAKQEKAIRLPDAPSSPEFWAAYAKALDLHPVPAASDTVSALIAAYQQSPEWRGLTEGTRVNWGLHLKRIAEHWGDLVVAGIRAKHVLALRDRYADRPGAANNMLRCLSVLLEWSVPREWRSDNPCLHVPKLKGGEGYEPWSWSHIELVRQHGPTWMWHATALALYTGQRQADILKMQWSDISGNLIAMKQEKTRKRLAVPLHRDLRAVLGSIPKSSTRILTSTRHRPWTNDGFRSSWQKALVGPLAAISDAGLVFHGLRKSAVCFLLEAGCSDAEVSAITGQSRQMVEYYSRMVNQKRLGANAILKWESSRRTL